MEIGFQLGKKIKPFSIFVFTFLIIHVLPFETKTFYYFIQHVDCLKQWYEANRHNALGTTMQNALKSASFHLYERVNKNYLGLHQGKMLDD